MPKYRKKPVVIEAFRIGIDPIPDWFLALMSQNEILIYPTDEIEVQKGPFTNRKIYCEINTLEGTMTGDYGDYIIRGVDGEVYPCKPEIFEKTYEKVEEQPRPEDWCRNCAGTGKGLGTHCPRCCGSGYEPSEEE